MKKYNKYTFFNMSQIHPSIHGWVRVGCDGWMDGYPKYYCQKCWSEIRHATCRMVYSNLVHNEVVIFKANSLYWGKKCEVSFLAFKSKIAETGFYNGVRSVHMWEDEPRTQVSLATAHLWRAYRKGRA